MSAAEMTAGQDGPAISRAAVPAERACLSFLQRSLKLSGKRPEYRMFGDELRLTVYSAHAPEA